MIDIVKDKKSDSFILTQTKNFMGFKYLKRITLTPNDLQQMADWFRDHYAYVAYGARIDNAVVNIKAKKTVWEITPIVTVFNGKLLTDDMSVDDCYKAVLGVSKADFDKKVKEEHAEYQRKEDEFKKKLPETIAKYKEMAKSRISDEDMALFEKILPTRVSDIYHGMEIQSLFDLMDAFKNKGVDEAQRLFLNQGHSGISAHLTLSLLLQFCHDKGVKEFVEKNW